MRPRLVVNSTDAAAEAAVSGLGLVRLVSYQADPLVRVGALAEAPLPDTRVIPIHLVQPGGPRAPAKARLFIEAIAADLRKHFVA